MFKGLINDAKSAAGSLVGKYLARFSVAVPFVVAFGFATAAATHMLVERFGPVTAYWVVAGGFVMIGALAMLVVAAKEHGEKVADKSAETTDTAEVATDAAAQAAVQAPLAILSALLTTPLGPAAIASGAKIAVRNGPLVVLLALISLLFWPSAPETSATEVADDGVAEPSATDGVAGNGMYRQAA